MTARGSSVQPTTTPSYTKGGGLAHLFRRIVHLCIFFVPILYYYLSPALENLLPITMRQLLIVILLLTVVFEALRLKQGWLLWGQRQHEAKQISSFSWGVCAICLVLLLADKKFAVPIIWCSALVDPLLGELRRLAWAKGYLIIIGLLAVMFVWWVAFVWYNTPIWLALLMAPIIIAAEWPNLKWIDDNALMMLIPLIVIKLLF